MAEVKIELEIKNLEELKNLIERAGKEFEQFVVTLKEINDVKLEIGTRKLTKDDT